jgi:hypothetical protein
MGVLGATVAQNADWLWETSTKVGGFKLEFTRIFTLWHIIFIRYLG